MVKKCLRCNADNDDNAIFCSSCGTRLSGARPGILGRATAGEARGPSIGFVMAIIGGFLITLGSVVFLFWTPPPPIPVPTDLQIILGVVFGLLVVLSSVLVFQPGYEMIGGMLAIVFSLLGLVCYGGLFFGTILGLLGGLMAILRK